VTHTIGAHVTARQPSAILPLMPNGAICWEDTCECQGLMNSGHQQHAMWNTTDGKAELYTKHLQVDGLDLSGTSKGEH
jgi:hypothetical protein